MISVVIAGGFGTRLWPLTEKVSKPLLKPTGKKTLLNITLDRLSRFTESSNIYISTTERLYREIKQSIDWPDNRFILEPAARGTAAAMALSVLRISKEYPDAVIGFFPADHYILNEDYFSKLIAACAEQADINNELVLPAATPKEPSTKYGYIETVSRLERVGEFDFFRCSKFIEKPDSQTAQRLIAGGKALWNCGIYIGRADVFVREICRTNPKMFKQITQYYQKPDFKDIYCSLEDIAFDRAVTEKVSSFTAANSDIKRVDIGSLYQLAGLWQADEHDNRSNCRTAQINSKNNIVHSSSKPVVLLGVENMVIIDTEEVLMVCRKEDIEKIPMARKLYKQIRTQ